MGASGEQPCAALHAGDRGAQKWQEMQRVPCAWEEPGQKDRGKDRGQSAWSLLGVRSRDRPSVLGTCVVMPAGLGALGGPSAEASPLGAQRGRKQGGLGLLSGRHVWSCAYHLREATVGTAGETMCPWFSKY